MPPLVAFVEKIDEEVVIEVELVTLLNPPVLDSDDRVVDDGVVVVLRPPSVLSPEEVWESLLADIVGEGEELVVDVDTYDV